MRRDAPALSCNRLPMVIRGSVSRWLLGAVFVLLEICASVASAAGIPIATGRLALPGDFNQPSSVAISKSSTIFVLDGTRGRVVAISADGKSSSFGQTGRDAAELFAPLDLFWADGRVYIADTGNRRIAVFFEDGRFDRNIALHPPGDTKSEPVAVAVQEGILAWADRKAHRFCRVRLDNQQELGCVGEMGEVDGQFQYPYQIAIDRDGYWQIVDIVNARIQVFDRGGRFFSKTGRFGLADDELFRPNGLAIDPPTDTQFIADSFFGTVSIFRNGQFLDKLRDADGTVLKFNSPTGLGFRDGRLYLAETGANRVWRIELGERPEAQARAAKAIKPVELSQKNCVICHLSWATDAPDALKQPDHKSALTDSSFAMCYSCHNGAIMDSRLTIHHGGQHPSLYDKDEAKQRRKQAGKRKDKFPDALPRTADGEMSCGTCHTPHTDKKGMETLYEGHKNAWLRIPSKGGDLCERCHESKAKGAREKDAAKRGFNHPLAVKLDKPPHEKAEGFTRIEKLHEGLPEKITAAGGALGHSSALVCQSCHQIHGGFGDRQLLTVDRQKGELCAVCHEAQYSKSKEDAHRKGIHPVNIKMDEPVTLGKQKVEFMGCQACHRVHSGSEGTSILPEGVASAEAMCKTCHQRQHAEDGDAAAAKGVHPVNVKLDDPVEIAGKKVREVGCLSCHSVHQGEPNTAVLLEPDRDGQLCAHCHKDKQTVVGSDHDLRVTAKDRPNRFDLLPATSGVCGACHTLHRGRGLTSRLFSVRKIVRLDREHMDETPFDRDRLCLDCHQKGGAGEKKIVRYFSHPHKDMVLRSDKKTMPLLNVKEKFSEFGSIACITCHEPHVWKHSEHGSAANGPTVVADNRDNLEGRNINSFLRHKGVSGTFCVDCHGMEGLVKYKYYHDVKRARGKGADYLE